MRILVPLRADWQANTGGDLILLSRWTCWLRHLGFSVDVRPPPWPDPASYDIVHFHNLGRAASYLRYAHRCRKARVWTVTTPLFWPTEEYDRYGRPNLSGWIYGRLPAGLRGRVKALAGCFSASAMGCTLWHELIYSWKRLAEQFLRTMDLAIVNSRAEADQLLRHFPRVPVEVVYAGVDARFWSDDQKLWAFEEAPVLPLSACKQRTSSKDERDKRQFLDRLCRNTERTVDVACVARFDPQKGQHRLLQALADTDLRVVLAGPDNPRHLGYRRLCQRYASGKTVLLGALARAQVHLLYMHSRVHALCSWYETTGLSGLEAGCCGARIVMTDRGGAAEYAGALAWYADPTSPNSIAEAIRRALQTPTTPDLRSRVRQHFTWECSARRLAAVYSLLGRARAHRVA
ncbi:MAG: hypothetical protein C4297_00040 [Gemmataceae bacterium]